MIPAIFVFLYLGVVLYIGIFAFRRPHPSGAEDFFLASRSLGPYVFLLSLFGTNMTAFTILGSSGHAFHNGVMTYGLMGSSSAFVIPLTIFAIGTRMWAMGKKFGFMTPVQMFRHRWECGHIGTIIFAVQAIFLVPYIIIGVMGGGTAMQAISGGLVPYWLGGALVAIVVMSYVFFGGMRGTAWVNAFQTVLFLSFGAVALVLIGWQMGGFPKAMEDMLGERSMSALLTRERVPPLFFLSYTFIPLSSIAFPHIAIFCLTAKHMAQFKKTVIFYPICILAIWLPCVFLGVAANRVPDSPKIQDKIEARRELAAGGPKLSAEKRAELRGRMAADDVVLLMLEKYAPIWLAGILGAGIMAAVMASDSQILALSTMFTEDVFAFYGGKERFGEAVQVLTGRVFVIVTTVLAYAIALRAPASIFDLAVQYAFSGFAAMAPLSFAALFWKGSTKWGALASTLTAIGGVVAVAVFQAMVPAPAGPPLTVWKWGGLDVLTRTANGTAILGLLPVVPLTLLSCALMGIVSKVTRKPSEQTITLYFGRS